VKPLKTLLFKASFALFVAGILFPVLTNAQCAGILKSAVYDTVINGTGNDYHSITLPQFDPSKGTLVSVKLSSVISLNYAFQLENNNSVPTSYNVQVGRNDFISSTALSSPATNMNNIKNTYGSYALAASNGVTGSGPDYISVPQFSILNNYNDISDSIVSSVASFLGTGNVELDYYSTTYYNISGNYNFNSTANDVINFSITYYYCNVVLLASDITDFSATKENDESIKLMWITQNEVADRVYEIEKSADGKNFTYITSVHANTDSNNVGHYLRYFNPTSSDKDKIYFRLKEIDKNGDTKYSEIRSVDLDANTQPVYLYPNPSNGFVNVVFNQPNKNWQVDIFAAQGALIQRNHFSNTNLAHIDFKNRMAAGMYFIRVIDEQSQKNYLLPLSVQ
jgi:hypothetical protein